jgi:hypothetical protein
MYKLKKFTPYNISCNRPTTIEEIALNKKIMSDIKKLENEKNTVIRKYKMENCVNEKFDDIASKTAENITKCYEEFKEYSHNKTNIELNQMYKIFEKKVEKIEAIQKEENEKLNKEVNNKIYEIQTEYDEKSKNIWQELYNLKSLKTQEEFELLQKEILELENLHKEISQKNSEYIQRENNLCKKYKIFNNY